MKLQHIYFCGSIDAAAYFKNQSELTQTHGNSVPFFIMLHISKPNLHILLEKNMHITQMIACVSAHSAL